MTPDTSTTGTPTDRPGPGVDAALLVMVVIWAGNLVVLKTMLGVIPPAALSAVRFTATSVLAYVVLAVAGGPWRVARGDLPRFGVAALTGVTFYQILFMEALDRSSMFATNLLQGTEPLFVLGLASALGMEHVRPRQWAGVLVAVGGTVVFFLQDAKGGAALGFGFGDLINLLSAASFATYSLVSAPLFARYPGRMVMAHTMGLGTLPLVAYGIPTLKRASWQSIPGWAWPTAAVSGTMAVYVGYWIWNWAINRKGLARTSVYLYLDIVMSGVFAYLFLGERFGSTRVLGAAIILLGVHLARQRLPPEPAA
jgi:drug/metabolite transporter (DMT)-like permease